MKNKDSISINSLSKTYKLYETKYDFLKEAFNPFRKSYHINFHALKNISFSVKIGEVLGIIGKNGSGKSTLLKILASVVTPTSGSFNCQGRVTALLELSGGFNRDLSGIENVKFLSALQGFSKKDIGKIIVQVLEFAEIGDYAFQPVKTYSSGMYMRLAFSLAISVEPDILIVDEVLAVGDVRFKQKCLKKIAEFKEQGKTIIICTHSLGTLKEFCTQAIWLHEGEVLEIGIPADVAENYSAFMTSQKADNQKRLFRKKVYIA